MKGIVQKLRLILTVRCEEASRIASDSLDRKLEIHERLALRGHQFVCWSCRQFEKQLHIMRESLAKARGKEEKALDEGPELSQEMKARLKKLI